MKISIIMPAYNSETYIERSIKSILNQTHYNLELIIINDGSKDNTNIIVEEMMRKDSRIVYFEIENSGSAVARNIGLENATGDYLSFVDSDDYIDEKMVEILLTSALEYNSDIVGCSFDRIPSSDKKPVFNDLSAGYYDAKDLEKKIYPFLFSTKSLKDTIPKTMWAKLYKRSLIRDNSIQFIPELRMSQDVVFTVTSLLYANSFYYLPNHRLYKYNNNNFSRTNTYLRNGWEILKNNTTQLKLISDIFPQYNLEKQLPYSLIRNAMTAILNIHKAGNNSKFREKSIQISEIVFDPDLQKALTVSDRKKWSLVRRILGYLIENKKLEAINILGYLHNKIFP